MYPWLTHYWQLWLEEFNQGRLAHAWLISGASGIVYGVRALQLLRDCSVETHLVISKSAKLTLHYELDMSLADLEALADEVHPINDIGASIASGSYQPFL